MNEPDFEIRSSLLRICEGISLPVCRRNTSATISRNAFGGREMLDWPKRRRKSFWNGKNGNGSNITKEMVGISLSIADKKIQADVVLNKPFNPDCFPKSSFEMKTPVFST